MSKGLKEHHMDSRTCWEKEKSKDRALDGLKRQYEELGNLCLNYNPSNKTNSEEVNLLLKKYHLTHIEDPFMVTNELLKLLDKCEGQIKGLK